MWRTIFITLSFFVGCSTSHSVKKYTDLSLGHDTYLITPNELDKNNNDTLIFYFHGSGGPTKWSSNEAYLISSNSQMRVVHFCWFNCNKKFTDDLDPIEEIDLNQIAKKINEVAISQSTKNIILIGISRGAELTALLISNPNLFGVNISKAVILSGTNVTAPGRTVIPRTILSERLKNPQRPSSQPFTATKPAWKINGIDIPTLSEIKVENFKMPLMIIHGDKDQLWSVQNAQKLKQLYEKNGNQARLMIMNDKGHVFPNEDKVVFGNLIKFIKL